MSITANNIHEHQDPNLEFLLQSISDSAEILGESETPTNQIFAEITAFLQNQGIDASLRYKITDETGQNQLMNLNGDWNAVKAHEVYGTVQHNSESERIIHAGTYQLARNFFNHNHIDISTQYMRNFFQAFTNVGKGFENLKPTQALRDAPPKMSISDMVAENINLLIQINTNTPYTEEVFNRILPKMAEGYQRGVSELSNVEDSAFRPRAKKALDREYMSAIKNNLNRILSGESPESLDIGFEYHVNKRKSLPEDVGNFADAPDPRIAFENKYGKVYFLNLVSDTRTRWKDKVEIGVLGPEGFTIYQMELEQKGKISTHQATVFEGFRERLEARNFGDSTRYRDQTANFYKNLNKCTTGIIHTH